MKNFALNDRVTVSSSGGWKNTFAGTICGGPEPFQTLQGPEAFYWVQFDESQEDVTGPDVYTRARVLSRYLEPARAGAAGPR